jgi:hypothetical protein
LAKGDGEPVVRRSFLWRRSAGSNDTKIEFLILFVYFYCTNT